MELINNKFILLQYIITMSWLLTHYEPFTMYLLQVNTKHWILQKIISVLTCWKCATLWIGFIVSIFLPVSPLDVATLSMIAYLLEKNKY